MPADFSAAQKLPVPLSELTAGKRILPFDDNTLYCSLYFTMSPELRTSVSSEADFLLVTDITSEKRTDYSGSAYNTCTSIYLCARDGAVYRVCDIWHSPPLFGRVKVGQSLRGGVASEKEIWTRFEKMLNDSAT